ncbi:hypothetical protein SAMN02745121_06269 [Nannocystis exedens]|uniref:Uncharacterized protein n=2 Tax=Nannocystis exedens TaxID=54 RepID=A0A1I2ESZ3_9BACT|nr:hypothetical protein NAEX_06900 [Nannocystis exedens]SFE95949.1 hypothetical protein SAMN02745121_06269 [Nannocystis exedens]
MSDTTIEFPEAPMETIEAAAALGLPPRQAGRARAPRAHPCAHVPAAPPEHEDMSS